MSKYVYTDEMESRMQEAAEDGVTEAVIETLCDEFEFPRRSVTAKLRKLGFDVPKKAGPAPVFSPEETEILVNYLNENSGVYTAKELADHFAAVLERPDLTDRQINGKALSLELTGCIKPAEKTKTTLAYDEAQSATVERMADEGAFIEDIAQAVNKTVPSVRGKLLSLGKTAPQRDKKSSTKSDKYAGIEDMAEDHTIDELVEHFEGSTARGVKTVLSRRRLTCKDYTPKSVKEAA